MRYCPAMFILSFVMPAFAVQPWDDPYVNAENRLEARAYLPPAEPFVRSLAGEWEFAWEGSADGNIATNLPDNVKAKRVRPFCIFTRPSATATLIQPFPNPTRTQPTATQPRAKTNHPSCRIKERFRHNHPTFAILRIDNVELHGLGSSINCLGRRVASYTTRDAKEIARLMAMVP